jgi:hypothetical protein
VAWNKYHTVNKHEFHIAHGFITQNLCQEVQRATQYLCYDNKIYRSFRLYFTEYLFILHGSSVADPGCFIPDP